MEHKTKDNKEVTKMVKVRINMPTLKPDFSFEDVSIYKSKAQLELTREILAKDTIIEVPEDVANVWCNEVFYFNDGIMGTRDPIKERLGIDKIDDIMMSNEISYSKKLEALNTYGAKMDKATKIAVSRATLIN